MSERVVSEIFDKGTAESYDKKNEVFAPISENLHFLIKLILKDLPKSAKVLCVGVGTGIEIIKLAQENPGWSFLGVDPSKAMLNGCENRIKEHGLSDRCELIHGYLSDTQAGEEFDVVLCLLVAHFIKDESERNRLFQDVAKRSKSGAYLIHAEISFDMSSSEFPEILEKWKAMQSLSGASKEHLDKTLEMMNEYLLLLPPEKTEELMKGAGFSMPVSFFQSLLIRGWYAIKK